MHPAGSEEHVTLVLGVIEPHIERRNTKKNNNNNKLSKNKELMLANESRGG